MNFFRKLILYFNVVLWVAFSPARAQQMENPENRLRFYTDFAGFRNFKDATQTYQEIYLSFPDYQFSYYEKEKSYLAGYRVSITIKDSTGNDVEKKEWQNFKQIDYMKEAEGMTSLEIVGFSLLPGNYTASIKLTDLNSQFLGFCDIPMTVPKFDTAGLQLSEIEFTRSIKKSNAPNNFVKNNIEVLPNPSRVFGIESPFVYFYAEIYNMASAAQHPPQLIREYSIVDDRGKIVKSSTGKIQPKSTSSIWVEKINMLDMVSGKYFLKLKVIDKVTNRSCERENEFWLNNPYKTISLAQYNDKDLEEFRAQIEYLVESKELDFFDQLNVRGKIEYINDFWKDKSPTFRAEHLKRFYTVQQRFDSPTMPGWKSDRGRVFIMYGPPDEILREPASGDSRAYEIWIYETLKKQGRVEFVFVDLGIFGNYRLVHSTLKGGERAEIYNPNWQEEIRIAR